jgi:hypothetical protein
MELTHIVMDTGEVRGYLAGFEIVVLKEKEFPYAVIFDYLLMLPHSIWVIKSEEKLVIKTKPVTD